jgi:hypothetical protein
VHPSLLWRRFSPLEEQLFAAVRGALRPSALVTFDAQVAAITRVQRHPDWTEIAFYRMRRGKVDWSGVPLFPREEELPLAEVRFQAGGRAFKARLTAIGGHIFDFAVTPSPRAVAFARWDRAPDVRPLCDPEDASAAPFVEPLPAEWGAFLANDRGAHAAWALHGTGAAYRVALDDGEFLVLAQCRGDVFLLWRLEPRPAGFFLQRRHDGTPEPLRESLGDLLAMDPGATPS